MITVHAGFLLNVVPIHCHMFSDVYYICIDIITNIYNALEQELKRYTLKL